MKHSPAILVLFVMGLFAGPPQAATKLGSIAGLNSALVMDPSARALSSADLAAVAREIRNAFAGQLYNEYTIPAKLAEHFAQSAEAMPRLMVEDVEKLSAQELVPSVIGLLEAAGRERKQELLRKVRRRLFVMEKARELNISAGHLEGLLECKLVLVPFIGDFASFQTGKGQSNCTWSAQGDVGVLLYEITGNETGQYSFSLRAKTRAKGIGMANCSEKDPVNPRMPGDRMAFRRMVANGVVNLIEASKQSSNAYVLTPIQKSSGRDIWFEGGRDNGIRVDDKRLLVLQEPDMGGGVKRKVKGWMVVIKPGKGGLGSQTQASLVAGKTRKDYLLETYPRWPIELAVGARTFSIGEGSARAGADSLTLETSALGGRVALLFNLGRFAGLRQILLGAAYSAGIGDAAGTQPYYSAAPGLSTIYFIHELEIPIVKRFSLGRLMAEVSAAYCFSQIRVSIEGSDVVKTNSSGGFVVAGGPALALTPSLTLQTRFSYRMGGETSDWTYREGGAEFNPPISLSDSRRPLSVPVSYQGSSLQAEIVWSLPAFGNSGQESNP